MPSSSVPQPRLPQRYIEACQLAEQGRYIEARRLYAQLGRRTSKKKTLLHGLIQNDLAVLDAVEGKIDAARERWRAAIEADGGSLLVRLNRDLLEAETSVAEGQDYPGELKLVPGPGSSQSLDSSLASTDGSRHRSDLATRATRLPAEGSRHHTPRDANSLLGKGGHHAERDDYVGGPASRVRVAILSFLFNWPSTGGGNMHTAGLVEFLGVRRVRSAAFLRPLYSLENRAGGCRSAFPG